MKKGYTLAEVMITLGIIGIVSALIFPLANKMKPNENKVRYLQTYDAISKIVKDLANDSSSYPVVGHIDFKNGEGQKDRDVRNIPFCNILRVDEDGNYNQGAVGNYIEDYNKLGGLIAKRLNTAENVDIDAISQQAGGYIAQTNVLGSNGINNLNGVFTTTNGVKMFITTRYAPNPTGSVIYYTDIYFDVNGDNLPNCIFDKENPDACPNPDIFKMSVFAGGQIFPQDNKGARYLETRNNMNDIDGQADIFDL